MIQNADIFNAEVKAWKDAVTAQLKKKFAELDIKHVSRSPSAVASRDALKGSTTAKFGLIAAVKYKFPRHMVFVAKGVGKGVSAEMAGTGETSRKPKDWFNSVIDANMPQLADTVANGLGDMIINNLRIK
jgi:hypothetical protein